VIVIGIDPGVTTGFAVWDALSRKLLRVESHSILKAHREVLFLMGALVIFEDARKIRSAAAQRTAIAIDCRASARSSATRRSGKSS
jgi:predicted RNase H-like nuclease (RuvC/YqgF family)